MPKKKKETPKIIVPTQEEVKLINTWNVYDVFGNFVRSYDFQTHGQKARELADTFAKKIHGRVEQA